MADSDSDLEIIDSLPDQINHEHRPSSNSRHRTRDSRAPENINRRGQSSHRDAAVRRRQRLQLNVVEAFIRPPPDADGNRTPQAADVIDLTDEPDTPAQPPNPPLTLPRINMPRTNHGMPARRNVGFLDLFPTQQPEPPRNPRRQPSGLARTPSLSRSDPTMSFGRGRSAVPAQMHIDLTEDDDSPPVPMPGGPSGLYPGQHPPAPPGHPAHGLPDNTNRPWYWDRLTDFIGVIGAGAIGAVVNRSSVGSRNHDAQAAAAAAAATTRGHTLQLEMERRIRMGPFIGEGAPPRDMLIQLDYGGPGPFPVGFWDDHTTDRPKPPYVPPPDAPDGFSRDTGEDTVAICPGCDEELVYDPDEVRDDQNITTSKKPRGKRDRAEHHFMAVKACGHVYCRCCYDQRTSSSGRGRKSGLGPHFRQLPDSTRLLCAVDGCASEVKVKTAWLGIFV